MADKLERYRQKRSAEATPEPFATRRPLGPRVFVVHLHGARHLHYDLRLEIDGVLTSFAIPKGPSRAPTEKRMAMLVEDHPLSYADFEGVIPQGNYGAGPMILWDRGTWVPIEDPEAGMESGKLLFDLHGYKLKGRWTLVRTKKKGSEDQKQWLLIKKPDAFATPDDQPYPAASVLSGLSLEELRAGPRQKETITADLEAGGVKKGDIELSSLKVMLAETAPGPFSDPGWIFELKYDGYRLLAEKNEAAVRLRYRSGKDATRAFPEIVRSLAAWPYQRVLLDGEVVVLGEDGRPSFWRLQERAEVSRAADIERRATINPVTMVAFDLLGFEGFDLRSSPLELRKLILSKLVPPLGPIRYSDHIDTDGVALYREVEKLGLEGLMAKDKKSPYRGARSDRWRKIRTEQTADFAVVGFTLPDKTTRTGFSALHLATADHEGRFIYAGKAGTGFDEAMLVSLRKTLDELVVDHAPIEPPVPKDKGTVWVEPKLVIEARYLEWTEEGIIRFPVFLRLRDDKTPLECRREKKLSRELGEITVASGTAAPATAEPASSSEAPVSSSEESSGSKSPLTNPEKIFWPQEKYKKRDLYEYYRDVSPWLLPYLHDRPVVVVRYPDGIEGKSFFQKDAPPSAPTWLRTERMWSEEAAREVDHFVVDDLDSLLYLANLGAIPLHIWASRVASLGRPDWCVLDLDPKTAPFGDVIKIAQKFRALLEELELPSYPKTSGSTGMHILIPLGGQLSFEQSKHLAELLARVVATESSEIATCERAVAARGGRVYLDFVQNGQGKLIVSPFSVRPVEGARVSMPLAWSEVKRGLDPAKHTILNARKRLERWGHDPMAAVLREKPNLPRALELLAARIAP